MHATFTFFDLVLLHHHLLHLFQVFSDKVQLSLKKLFRLIFVLTIINIM